MGADWNSNSAIRINSACRGANRQHERNYSRDNRGLKVSATKTDNHNPEAKLELRRYFLRKYHADKAPRVMDCFQGQGLLWEKLSAEFKLANYWGVDMKPKKGRLKIDSARILSQRGWMADVVDLDAYGSPWGHWMQLCETCETDNVTIFLTIGMVKQNGFASMDSSMATMAGCVFKTKAPRTLLGRIVTGTLPFALRHAKERGLDALEIVEAFPQKNARYIGLRMEKRIGQTKAKQQR